MAPSRFITILLFVAGTLLHFSLAFHCREFPTWSSLIYCGFSCGQLTILAAWLACGQRYAVLRVSAILAAGVVTASVMAGVSQAEFTEFFWFCSLIGCLVALPLTLLRVHGLVLMHLGGVGVRPGRVGPLTFLSVTETPHAERIGQKTWPMLFSGVFVPGAEPCDLIQRVPACREDAKSSVCQSRSRQFSLAGLMAWMTVTAILCGAARWMEVPWHHLWQVATYAVAVALAGAAGVWAVFSPVRLRWRLIGGLAAALAVCGGLLVCAEVGPRYHEARPLAVISWITFLTAGGAGLALSAAGVRLVIPAGSADISS